MFLRSYKFRVSCLHMSWHLSAHEMNVRFEGLLEQNNP